MSFPYFKNFQEVEKYTIEKYEKITRIKLESLSQYFIDREIEGIYSYCDDIFFPQTEDFKKNYKNIVKTKVINLSQFSLEVINLCILLNCHFNYFNYTKIHPNRIKLYFFGFYTDNNRKERFCSHYIEKDFEDEEDNFCSDDDCDSIDTSSPHGMTPIECSDIKGYCWCFYSSNCENCNFKTLKTKKGECLPCYYFTNVLNEIHEKFGEFNFGLKQNKLLSFEEITKDFLPKDIINIISNFSNLYYK